MTRVESSLTPNSEKPGLLYRLIVWLAQNGAQFSASYCFFQASEHSEEPEDVSSKSLTDTDNEPSHPSLHHSLPS